MKVTISSHKKRLVFIAHSIHNFRLRGFHSLGLDTLLKVINFVYNYSIKLIINLLILPVYFSLFEKLSLIFLKREVNKWEEEKLKWMEENDKCSCG